MLQEMCRRGPPWEAPRAVLAAAGRGVAPSMNTLRTAVSLGSMEMRGVVAWSTSPVAATTSRGLPWAVTPSPAAAAAAAALTSNTCTCTPAWRRFATMPEPIFPKPRKPTALGSSWGGQKGCPGRASASATLLALRQALPRRCVRRARPAPPAGERAVSVREWNTQCVRPPLTARTGTGSCQHAAVLLCTAAEVEAAASARRAQSGRALGEGVHNLQAMETD